MANKDLMTRRGSMFLVGFVVWLMLVFWTASAFWHHIDQLKENYQNAAKIGALASEFVILAMLCWHCFDKHIGVRKWSLIFSFTLSCIVLIHAGALRGMNDATAAQIGAEQRTAETLTKMSEGQAAVIQGSMVGTQRERLASDREAKAQQAEIAKNAQKEAAATIAASAEKVKESSIFPAWYLEGWMYSILFICALAMCSFIFKLMMNTDIDADFDGVIDSVQSQPQRTAAMSLAPATAKSPNTTISHGGSFTPPKDF